MGSGSEVMGELSIDVALFHQAFAADLPEEQAPRWPGRNGPSR